jgi:glutathione S-transferase/GST-like protein
MLEVYTWEPNANSGKPLLCLKEKGVEFVYHYIDMSKLEQHSARYLQINPKGTVPTIIHEGRVLTESTPAMEYLDEVFPSPPLRPKDPYQLWRMRKWCRYMDQYVCPSLAMIGAQRAVATAKQRDAHEIEQLLAAIPLPERRRTWALLMSGTTPAHELEESQRRVGTAIAVYEEALAQSPYLAGSEYSLADINTLVTIYALPLLRPQEVNAQRTPHLLQWFRRCYARPAIQAAFALGHEWVAGRALEMRRFLGLG